MEYLDANQTTVHNLIQTHVDRLDDLRMLDIIEKLKPKFSQDGNQYCFILGEMPEHYIAGFGNTPYEAMQDFCKSFYNQKALIAPSIKQP